MEVESEILRCYICDEEIHDNGKDIFSSTTDYSSTALHELLEKLTGQEIKAPDENKCLGCSSCIEKINEYDLACITAERVQKELTCLLQQTAEKYYQNIEVISNPKDEVLDIDHVIVHDEVTYVVKDVTADAEDYSEPLEEETNEFEVQFFTVDVDNTDNNEETKTELQDQEEYINYEGVERDAVEVPVVVAKEAESNIGRKRTAKPKKNTFCKMCRMDFSSFKELSAHRKEKHDNGERLVCDICGVRYKTRSALNIHIDIHNGISPFRCEVCGKNFTQKGALKRHRAIHTGERPYQCDKCGKQFTHYSSFHMHNLAHDDVRDKKCEICGLLLRSSSHLNRHMLVHTGQKPHACPKCGQRFAQRYNMMSHLRSHQGIHRRKKYSCDVCNKGFTKESLLQKHIVEKACEPSEAIDVYKIISNRDFKECKVVVNSDSSS